MIYAFDTYYLENNAKTVCFGFNDWETEQIDFKLIDFLEIQSNEYESGQFYKRELPCILQALSKINLKEGDLIIIDGFVYLDDNKKIGLGGHLFEELIIKIPIIGVAKSNFATLDKLKRTIYRGESKKALYITSILIDIDIAANYIKQMKGEFRIPNLLKLLDQETKITDIIK